MSWREVTASSRKITQGARGAPQWSQPPELGANLFLEAQWGGGSELPFSEEGWAGGGNLQRWYGEH